MIDPVGAQLIRSGRVLRLVTHGRLTARAVEAAVGYVEEAGGSLLIAAGDFETNWARNLLADPRCDVTLGDRPLHCRAEVLDDADRAVAVRELILKYGTPSERLGGGPAFRLRPE